MKKKFAVLIAIVFLGSSLSLPAFAAVKAGAKCKTLGAKSISSGKSFTCIKSGKKLVWNKGTAVKKTVSDSAAKSPVSQTATPPTKTTSEPVPVSSQEPKTAPVIDPTLPKVGTACLSSDDDSYGYDQSNNIRFLTCASNGTKYLWVVGSANRNLFKSDRDGKTPLLGTDPNEAILFNAFNNFLQAKKPGKLNFNYFVDPKFQADYEMLVRSGSETFEKLMGGHFKKRRNFYVVMITDREFGEKVFENFASTEVFSRQLMNSQRENLIRYIDQRTSPQQSSAYATHENTENVLLVYISNPELKINIWKIGAVFHETYHQLQFDMTPNQTSVLPCWFVEGQPNFIALAMGFEAFGVEKTYIMLRQMWSNSKSSEVSLLNLEGNTNRVYGSYCGNIGEYEQGAIGNAFLIHKYGIDKVFQLYSAANNARPYTDDWVRQFETIFGLQVESFYNEAEQYIKWFMSKYINE
jgi:hypothetical protein